MGFNFIRYANYKQLLGEFFVTFKIIKVGLRGLNLARQNAKKYELTEVALRLLPFFLLQYNTVMMTKIKIKTKPARVQPIISPKLGSSSSLPGFPKPGL